MLTAIDTHQFVKSFIMATKTKEKSAEKQAEVIAKAINEAQETNFKNLATKGDLQIEVELLRREIKIAMLTTIISLSAILAFIEKFIG